MTAGRPQRAKLWTLEGSVVVAALFYSSVFGRNGSIIDTLLYLGACLILVGTWMVRVGEKAGKNLALLHRPGADCGYSLLFLPCMAVHSSLNRDTLFAGDTDFAVQTRMHSTVSLFTSLIFICLAVTADGDVNTLRVVTWKWWTRLRLFIIILTISVVIYILFRQDSKVCIDITDAVILLISQVILLELHQILLCTFQHSFTIGELTVVCQLAVHILYIVLHRSCHVMMEQPNLVQYSEEQRFCAVVVMAVVMILMFQYTCPSLSSPVLFYCCHATLATVSFTSLYAALNENPLAWFFTYLVKDRGKQYLMLYWITCSVITVTVIYRKQSNLSLRISPNFRKFFHLVVIVVFIPGLISFPPLLCLASVIAFAVFIELEILRYFRIAPLGEAIESSFRLFADSKDSGPILLTHIYLLVGTSLPIWLSSASLHQEIRLSWFSGIISLGVGDTAASLFGSLIGRNNWPGSLKTIEGSMAGFLAQVITVWLLYYSGAVMGSLSLHVLLTIGLTSLFEAFTHQIDNLVLPVFMYALLEIKL